MLVKKRGERGAPWGAPGGHLIARGRSLVCALACLGRRVQKNGGGGGNRVTRLHGPPVPCACAAREVHGVRGGGGVIIRLKD